MFAVGCRVAFKGRLDIRIQIFPDFRKPPEELQRDFFCCLFPLRSVHIRIPLIVQKRQLNLLPQTIHHVFNNHGNLGLRVHRMVYLLPIISREQHCQKLIQNHHNLISVRLFEELEIVDIPALLVILQNSVHDLLHFQIHLLIAAIIQHRNVSLRALICPCHLLRHGSFSPFFH